MAIESQISNYYKNAITSQQLADTYLSKIQNELGYDADKILTTVSICSDEVNNSVSRFLSPNDRHFNMGGLAGLPHTGVTGMIAYAHHVPDGGIPLIIYGPHIGISDDGELGKLLRPGQSKLSGSCGALLLALGRMSADENHTPSEAANDYQQTTIEKNLLPHRAAIVGASNQVHEITEQAFKVIDKQIHENFEAAKGEFHCKQVALLGGVLINTSPSESDYFDVRNFEIIDL